MTEKIKVILFFAVFLLIVASAGMISYYNRDDRLPITLKVVKTGPGWGYEIAVDGKTFIRQSTIPAVDGNVPFSTKEQALLVGNHAIAKLKTGKMPQITLSELKDWGVIKKL